MNLRFRRICMSSDEVINEAHINDLISLCYIFNEYDFDGSNNKPLIKDDFYINDSFFYNNMNLR